MKLMKNVSVTAMLICASSVASAYDCNSDCKGGGFDYPCPTFDDPGRWCHSDLPNDPACLAAKAASCQIWEGAVNFTRDKIKPLLVGKFNAGSWRAAEEHHSQNDYMATCVAAGVAACGALGAQLGGPWGATVSGAVGTFVSFRICEQSKAW